MTGPRLNTLLAAIAREILTALPALKTCDVHDGRFGLKEVTRWSREAPAVLVSWLGTQKTEQPGIRLTDCHHRFGAFVMTRDTPELARGAAARNIVDQLLLVLPRARWGDTVGSPGIGEATDIRVENLYSGESDRMGISLCALVWNQTLRLETTDDTYCPPLPDDVYSSYDGCPFVDIINPAPSHKRYYGWVDSQVVTTADLAAAHVSNTDIGILPARSSNGYFWYAVPVAAEHPDGIRFLGRTRTQSMRQLPNSVNDPDGTPYLVGITKRRQSPAVAGLGIRLVYP